MLESCLEVVFIQTNTQLHSSSYSYLAVSIYTNKTIFKYNCLQDA